MVNNGGPSESLEIDTYHHHGQKDEACGSSLPGAAFGVDERIDGGCDQNHTAGKITSHGDMVGVNSVARDNDKDSDDEE